MEFEDNLFSQPDETLEDLEEDKNFQLAKELKKPILSKWMFYLSENRKSIAEKYPDLSQAQRTKLISDNYKNLTKEEEDELLERINNEKKNYLEKLLELGYTEHTFKEKLKKYSQNINDTNQNIDENLDPLPPNIPFPLARIKRIAKMDDEVKNISKEGVLAITKATELFISRLALKCGTEASLRKGKTIKPNDLYSVIYKQPNLEFLRNDFPKSLLITEEKKKKTIIKKNNLKKINEGEEGEAEAEAEGQEVEGEEEVEVEEEEVEEEDEIEDEELDNDNLDDNAMDIDNNQKKKSKKKSKKTLNTTTLSFQSSSSSSSTTTSSKQSIKIFFQKK